MHIFFTLRSVPSAATQVIYDDSDGPGHAPPYLGVSHIFSMRSRFIVVIVVVLALIGLGVGIRSYRKDRADLEVLDLIKTKHPDWQSIEPIRETNGVNRFSMNGKTITYVIQFKTKSGSDTWYYSDEDRKWMAMEFPSGAFVEP